MFVNVIGKYFFFKFQSSPVLIAVCMALAGAMLTVKSMVSLHFSSPFY